MPALFKNRRLRGAAVLLFWLIMWQALSIVVNSEILLSGPLETALTLAEKVPDPDFWLVIGLSFLRIVTGFTAAVVCSLLFGFAAWRLPVVAEFINPAITFIKSVPIVCFVVLLLIWFGSENVTPVAVFLVAFPAFYFACLEGLKHRNVRMSELIRVFGLPLKERILVFHWPGIRPFIQATARIAVGMSWKSGIAAELIGLPMKSIGMNIYQAKITLSSAEIFAWTFVLVGITVLCEKLVLRLLECSEDHAWSLALRREPRGDMMQHAVHPVRIENVSKHFGERRIVSNFSVTLAPGSRLALFAPSGSGKTTFLRLLAGLEKPDMGRIEGNARVASVFQESCLFEGRSAIDNIRIFCSRYHSTTEIYAALEAVLPAHSLNRPVAELSGGMRRRVELVRALLSHADLILLDEPFSGLDSRTLEQAYKLTDELLGERTLVIASHVKEDIAGLNAEVLQLQPTAAGFDR
ncbi:MAG TPA: hypothetical protein DEB24_01265 [Coriobacteriia bacterium]|nr:hypothetical protein [Coriobacteriia bacterium]